MLAFIIKVIYIRSYLNSRKGSLIKFASLKYINSEIFKVKRISNKNLIKQDLKNKK